MCGEKIDSNLVESYLLRRLSEAGSREGAKIVPTILCVLLKGCDEKEV